MKAHTYIPVALILLALLLQWGCDILEVPPMIPRDNPMDPAYTGIPGIPDSVSAEAVSSTEIKLRWRDKSANETGFIIVESVGDNAHWAVVDSVAPVQSINSIEYGTYTRANRVPNTRYHYKVRAYNAQGASSLSSEASATPVVLAPTNLTATVKSSTSIELKWTDNSTDEQGFKVERKVGSGAWGEIKVLLVNSEAYSDTGLFTSTTYGYRVRAYTATDMSAYSNEASAVPVFVAGATKDVVISGVTFTFAWIPAGSFQMGSPAGEKDRDSDEGPVHSVTFASGYWMLTTEVTQKQWKAIVGTEPSYWKGDNLPVEQVSWDDIQTFEANMNISDAGKGYRLPSEAEWEYACRAGTTTRFYWGDDLNYTEIGKYAWYVGNSGSKTNPVRTRDPNAWGLYDMSGNVYEWCEDWYHSDYTGAPSDGSPWLNPAGSSRVLRGGSGRQRFHCRSANRSWNDPDGRNDGNGFRLVSR